MQKSVDTLAMRVVREFGGDLQGYEHPGLGWEEITMPGRLQAEVSPLKAELVSLDPLNPLNSTSRILEQFR